MFNFAMNYLKERQSPGIRHLHILILLLVISQILVSEFIEFNDAGEISQVTIEFISTWTHIITGMLLLPIALAFALIELRKHGFSYFYPYLQKDFKQIKSDIEQLKKFELPESSAKGLAPVVQGLGLGALFLVILSGLSWYLLWSNGVQWADDIKEVHELFTGLIETYIFAHGAMGLLHIYLSYKKENI
jgi:hypothetical protein